MHCMRRYQNDKNTNLLCGILEQPEFNLSPTLGNIFKLVENDLFAHIRLTVSCSGAFRDLDPGALAIAESKQPGKLSRKTAMASNP